MTLGFFQSLKSTPKKITFFWGLFSFFALNVTAQQYILKDKQTNESIPYATVIYNAGGVYSNQKGEFELEKTLTGTIEIRSMGYKMYKNSVEKLPPVIERLRKMSALKKGVKYMVDESSETEHHHVCDFL